VALQIGLPGSKSILKASFTKGQILKNEKRLNKDQIFLENHKIQSYNFVKCFAQISSKQAQKIYYFL